jgi:hypothetical protein
MPVRYPNGLGVAYRTLCLMLGLRNGELPRLRAPLEDENA